ncbi:esterase/lipase family protein [Hazenella coriacea]|uniref:Lipase (Class 2) n=1 Tax=Hazenella coriacea TaxID=1179467 RepID=A0A4R3L8C7_9BACL|nr:hypothetical protein [Hazenella coriacea]TCS95909.1 lipase (class 2) [Hazenella coriacea]
MKSVFRLFSILLLCACLVIPMGVSSAQSLSSVPAPKVMGQVGGEVGVQSMPTTKTPGTWFVGATPPNYDPSKPPIVFVQGMNGKAQDWWEETVYAGVNDMYETAYRNGYRTAFVQLYDAKGDGAASQWDNGRLLASMLEQIHRHFGQKVNIVAHSKGGPDTQAALIHYGAHPYVGRVVTLGSPHHGSHLANLAHSWYAGWLAELLGKTSDGTYALQTGQMEQYRKSTDQHPNVSKNTYYTLAGTSWGPRFTALWTGGSYLSVQGSNDGLVNVWSTQLPYGKHLLTGDADHDNIRTGFKSFAKIESVLRSSSLVQSQTSVKPSMETSPESVDQEQWVDGAPLSPNQIVEKTLYIEENSSEANIQVLTKSKAVQVQLVSPSGKVYKQQNANRNTTDQAFFAGAHVKSFHVSRPEAGTWKISMTSPVSDAYLLIANLGTPATFSADVPLTSKEKAIPLQVKLNKTKNLQVNSLQIETQVVTPDGTMLPAKETKQLFKQNRLQANQFRGQLKGIKPGVYNITIEIKGKTKQGEPFERTMIRSVYIGE